MGVATLEHVHAHQVATGRTSLAGTAAPALQARRRRARARARHPGRDRRARRRRRGLGAAAGGRRHPRSRTRCRPPLPLPPAPPRRVHGPAPAPSAPLGCACRRRSAAAPPLPWRRRRRAAAAGAGQGGSRRSGASALGGRPAPRPGAGAGGRAGAAGTRGDWRGSVRRGRPPRARPRRCRRWSGHGRPRRRCSRARLASSSRRRLVVGAELGGRVGRRSSSLAPGRSRCRACGGCGHRASHVGGDAWRAGRSARGESRRAGRAPSAAAVRGRLAARRPVPVRRACREVGVGVSRPSGQQRDRRRLPPPGWCRRTSVPSLMMRSPRGRARTRRLPAVPTARRRVRSIVQFSGRGAR